MKAANGMCLCVSSVRWSFPVTMRLKRIRKAQKILFSRWRLAYELSSAYCPCLNKRLNFTTAIWLFGVCCCDYIWQSQCFLVIWTRTEGAIFHLILHAHFLGDRSTVCNKTPMTVCQICGCFSLRSSKPSQVCVCQRETETTLSILWEILNWYFEFHVKYVTWQRTCSWLLEIW